MSAQLQGSPEGRGYRTFEVELQCGAGGAEVRGLDVSRPLPAEALEELRRALADHCVLFFRDQALTPEQQKAFALQFGALSATPFIQPRSGEKSSISSQPNGHTNQTCSTPCARRIQCLMKHGEFSMC